MKFRNGVCTSKARLDGKTALITGANTGIGKVTAEDFYRRGARVLLACRDLEKAKEAVADIKKSTENENQLGKLILVHLDLNSLASVRSCAEHVLKTEKRLDLLINNAGVMATPDGTKTKDGFECQFGVNYLGHFLFTLLLLPRIIETPGTSRIVNVSSLSHTNGKLVFDDLNYEKRRYSAGGAYEASKLMQVLFTKELAKRLEKSGITGVNVYSLHPGAILTELGRHLDDTYFRGLYFIWRVVSGLLLKTAVQGAQTTIYCAVDEKAGQETGLYYSDCEPIEPAPAAKNMEDAKKLWDLSVKLCRLNSYNPFSIK